ncbi:GNAT family N-acetyltransferase [Paraburkholderia sp. UCT31]|uniref:GNAT family N-acetyltransferase n=1 Tax=Paraburkholderia sp. UCT31 TaxID=2615209 RepID=UPI001655062D|nr:GNAT family N-acetyltransferase [Paraburkholderia sp. UCT31]MBC8737196.1 GNAT family N-acetyltransferase [Paraburkholderia sp. UCT31]
MYTLRLLTQADLDRLEALLLGLSPENRRRRFCGNVRDHNITAYVQRIDFSRAQVVGAFTPAGELAGVCELAFAAVGDTSGEMAFAVAEAHQGHGLGSRLVARALDLARAAGVQALEVHYQSGNTPARRLTRRFNGVERWYGGTDCTSTVRVADGRAVRAS